MVRSMGNLSSNNNTPEYKLFRGACYNIAMSIYKIIIIKFKNKKVYTVHEMLNHILDSIMVVEK